MNFILKEITLLGLFVFFLIFLTNTNISFSENAGIYIDDDFYEKSDIISIWGSTLDAPQNLVFISIVDPDGNTIWIEKISVDEEGDFSTSDISIMFASMYLLCPQKRLREETSKCLAYTSTRVGTGATSASRRIIWS